MSFLAPFFLVGIALIAGPILFHLMRQAPRNRVVFSSTELLEPSQPKQQKSRRIQNPWLLLVRCSIIALLAFAFARPFIPTASPNQESDSIRQDVVIAIDQSASMNRSDIPQKALEQATALIESLNPYDQLSVFAFSDTIETIVSNEQWSDHSPDQRKRFALQQLASWKPLNLPGKLDLAISEAVSEVEALKERSSDAGFSQVYVISDFAEGTSLGEIERIDWPAAMRLTRVSVQAQEETPNLALRWLNWKETDNGKAIAQLSLSSSKPELPSTATIRATNALTGSPVAEPIEIALQDESEHIVQVPIDSNLKDQPLTFTLTGDQQDFDNVLPIAPEYIPEAQIGLISSASVSESHAAPYFVQKGVQGFESPRTSINADTPLSADNEAYFIDRALNPDEAATLRSAIENGKYALLIADVIEVTDTLKSLTGSSEWKVEERSLATGLLIGEVNFEHPLFAPFASPQFSNFANINIWQAPEIAAPETARILARFDDETPLLTEIKIGTGTLYIWTGSWAPEASQWVLSSKFIPFLHRFVLQASGGPALPSNTSLTRDSIDQFKGILSRDTVDSVGVYEVPGFQKRWIAFHPTLEESKVKPISEDRWDQLGLPEFEVSVALQQIERIRANSNKESAVQLEQRQHIWQWLLWVVLALLAVESLLAIITPQKGQTVS